MERKVDEEKIRLMKYNSKAELAGRLLFAYNTIRRLEEKLSDKNATCTWTEDGDSNYEAQCNNKLFCFNDGSLEENGFKFCPYCGKPMIAERYKKKGTTCTKPEGYEECHAYDNGECVNGFNCNPNR